MRTAIKGRGVGAPQVGSRLRCAQRQAGVGAAARGRVAHAPRLLRLPVAPPRATAGPSPRRHLSHAASPGAGGLHLHVRFRHYLPTRTIHRLCIPIPLRLCLTVPSFVHGLGMYISVLGLVYIFLALCVSDRVSCLLDAVHEHCPPCRCCSQNATVARTMCLLRCLNQHSLVRSVLFILLAPWFQYQC